MFDGSGGFPLAGLMAGIVPVWASEIEPFPIRVTTRRLPFMKHYGNICTMDGGKIEPVDIITFGSPCTDLSVAGRRAGLDGKQSSLFYQAIRIIKEMRLATNGRYPQWICWENVPGAFSSNQGRDFQAVLEAVIGIIEPGTTVPPPDKAKWPEADVYLGEGWSLAYRTLDAQYWGLPQRRKRIFLVASLASQCARKVLFESEGLSGYSAEGFRKWQRATQGSASCSGATGFDGYNSCLTGDVSSTLGINCGMSTGRTGVVLNDQGGASIGVSQDVTATLRAENHSHPPCVLDSFSMENYPIDGRIEIQEDEMVQTLTSRMGTGGMNVPLILNYIPECMGDCTPEDDMEFREVAALFNAFGICSVGNNCMKSDNPHSGFFETSIARTLDGNGGNPTCNQGGIAVVEPIPFTQNQRNEVRILGNQSGALSAESGSKQQTYVLQGSMIGRKNVNGPQGSGINEDVSFTLNTIDRHAVVYEEQDLRQIQTGSQKDVFGTLEANCGTKLWLGNQEAFTGDYHILEPDYAVRRLTPTECARLQGFPDWWCSNLDTPAPTETEIQFWSEVFEVHRNVVGTSSKPKSKKQIIKWLRSPHSDAAEYKMWGNGVALPCVFFVLAGISYYAEKPQDSSISQS